MKNIEFVGVCQKYFILRGDWIPENGCFFGKLPKGGGVISDPKNYIADFVGFKAVYFGGKKRNVISKKGGRGRGVIANQGRLEVFQKNINF